MVVTCENGRVLLDGRPSGRLTTPKTVYSVTHKRARCGVCRRVGHKKEDCRELVKPNLP